MSTALHTSSEGHRSAAAAAASLPRPQLRNTKPEVHRDDGTATTTITETTPQRRSTAQPLSTSTDTDGLRCEVLSMRSVPHALYTLPSVSHVVAAYVRQLMDDFASSLLMCRPARRYVFQDRGSKNANGESESTAMKSGVAARATVLEDEETYLTLGLCALEARQRRRWRHAQHTRRQHRVAEDEAKDDDNSFDWLWDSAVSGDGDRNGGDTVRLHPNLAAVESQLIELFATTAQARRGGNCSSHHHETSRLNSAIGADGAPTFLSASAASSPQPPLPPQPHPDEEVDPSLLTPPLLSSLLRFKPLLRDMQFLSRHLLLPRHTWSHHQREWVSVYEDVSVTLRDRLARYQATTTTAVSASDRDVGDADEDASSKAAERVEGDSAKRVGGGTRVMPASEVEQLWYTLWELLGAAWRQRDRLWGAYRYLQGPRQLPPLSLSSQAARAPPPGVHSSPLLRDQHARHLVHAAQTMNRNHPRRPSRAPPSLVSAHDEDSCAFGPFTSSDVGVSSDRLYVLRQPLAAALRSLRVCVPASGRDALATSTTAFAGFTYVTARAGSSATAAPQSAPQSSPPPPCVVVPLFDATEEDARLRAAVPYLSPEVYLSQQLRHQQQQQQKRLPFQQEVGEDSAGGGGAGGHAPVHRFSDDVWNAAVVVLEAALSGFAVSSSSHCHLSHAAVAVPRVEPPSSPERTNRDADTSPDADVPALASQEQQREPASLLSLPLLPTDSVYTAVLLVLTQRHGLSPAAAHNFLYAALHHLRAALRRCAAANADAEGEEAVEAAASSPAPARLAREWLTYLCTTYGHGFVCDFFAGEVAAKGLCWRRSERWNAFGAAHITAATTVAVTSRGGGGAPCPSATAARDPPPTLHGSAANSIMSPLSVAGSDPGSATDRNPLRASHFAAAAAARQGSNALDDDTNNSYQSEQQQQQQQQQRARYTAGSIGSMSVLSDDGNSDLMLGGITYPAGEDASTSPHNKLAASPNTFELTATTQHQQQRQRPPSSLPVTLPSCPDSLASFDAFIQGASAPASPLRSGHSFAFSAGTSFHAVAAAAAAATTTTTATAPARLPQKLDRAIGVLDTPLLPLFGLPGSLGESLPVSEAAAIAAAAGSPSQEAPPQQRIQRDGAWEQLERFLHHRARSVESSTASGNSRNNQSGTLKAGGGGGGSGKANGAVADAADVDCVEALLHLLYACVLSTLRHAGQRIRVMEARTESSSSSNTKKTKSNAADEDCARYAAVNHPFLRGVAERGLLSTYMTVCGCSRATVSEDESTPPQQLRRRELPSLNLYVPTRVLRATIADFEEHDAAAIVPAGEGDLRDVKDTLTAASSIVAALERQRKQTGALRTLIGDDVRAWEAARDATRRSRENYFSYWSDYAQRPVQPPAPVHRARPAVDAVLRSMELSVSVQLHHVGQLRRLLSHGLIRDAAGGAFVGSGRGETEKEVRRYLRTHVAQIERSGDDDGDAAADAGSPPPSLSPFFVVPPTMRGVLWGCLLHVPAGRRREAIFAYAVHRTAAKPSLNDRQLAVDIPRCHAYHPLLASSKGSAQLQRLLKAWLFLHPRYAYWQGLDSVCAVLLTVSPHDEAMVLAQLDAIVDGFIAHDDGSGGGGGEDGFGSRSSLLMPAATASSPLTQQPKPKPSMADQLHRLSVVLRYCDPLLAHYLFGVLGCTPELYAISWLLTLFSHSLPTRKVHLLWDLLFVEGDVDSGGGSACLVALCAAVMVHRRAALLSSDFSGCLTAFSSGTSQLDVAAAVGDTRRLLSVLPPSVLAQPVADDVVDTPHGGRRPRQRPSALARGAAAAATAGSGGASSATDTATLAYLSVEDLKSAWAVAQRRTASSYDPTGAAAEGAAQRQQHWSDTGVYLVDIRPCDPRTGPHDSLLSAIHLPLHPAGVSPTPSASLSFGHIAPPSPRTAEVPDRAPQNGSRGDRRSRQDVDEVEQRTTAATAGEGWGIVDEQERLQEQQQLTQEAQERHVADAAAELVRFMGNPFVAAIVPCTSDASDRGASWAVHPLVLKTSMAPHVVIVAGDGKSTSSNSSTAGESEEVELAHQLGLQLNACGVHNVSVLRGGMAAIRVAMPELVVPHAQES